MVARYGWASVPVRTERPRVAVGDSQADRASDRAGDDFGTHRAIPGAEPPILVDHQPNTRRDTGVDHRHELGSNQGGRLLTEDVHPMSGRQLHELSMRISLGTNLDKVELLLLLEKRGGFEVTSRFGNPCSGPLQPHEIHVAKRNQSRIGHMRPCFQMILRHEPTANHGAPEWWSGAIHGGCLAIDRPWMEPMTVN